MPFEPIDFQQFFANLKANKANREELSADQIKTRQRELFDIALQKSALAEFGKRYVDNHRSSEVTRQQDVIKMISATMTKNIGFYIAGVPGSGKTHILLEYYYTILSKHYAALEAIEDYPNGYGWFKREVKYYYASWISDLIRNKQKPVIAKVNLLDDFMVEEYSDWMLAGWDSYIEEINRQDGVMVVTSNVSLDDVQTKPQYARLCSRILGNCKKIVVPSWDRRVASI
jgi:DNA replication protein DnaC